MSTKELANYLEMRYPEETGEFITTTRVSQLRTDVAKKLVKQFEAEMVADEIAVEDINNSNKGGLCSEKRPYRIAADWLWNYQYQRWLVDRALQPLIAGAAPDSDWIAFELVKGERALKPGTPRPKPPPPSIPLKVPFCVSIKLPKPEGYFLLLNRGFVTRLILCPSVGIAPSPQISGQEILMPQEDAQLENIYFDERGKEEFIGIFVDSSLDLDWLKPNQQDSIPICTPERINELLFFLKETEYQVFYQSLEVQ